MVDLAEDPPTGRRHVAKIPKLRGMKVADAMVEIEKWMRSVRDGYSGKPGPHAQTHLGGNDNLVSDADPIALEPGSVGDPGDPSNGVAAADHVHDMSAFDAILDLEDALDADGLLQIRDETALRLIASQNLLLREILKELIRLRLRLT